jgi:uncharacterized protein (TIGR03437 family)
MATPAWAASSIALGATGCSNLGPSQSCTLTATVNAGLSNQTVNWNAGAYTSSLAYLTTAASSAGAVQPNTFTAPATIAAKTTVTVTVTASDNTTATASVTLVPSVAITVSPATVTLTEGQGQQFSVTPSNSSAIWSISPQVGSISQGGYYVAPTPVPASQKVTVTATAGAASGTATITLNTTTHIGDGAPTPGLSGLFLQAYQRGMFALATSLPPLGNVKALGSTGYVQEFPDADSTSGVKLALVTANMATNTSLPPIYQIYSPLYVYYSSFGVGTAGYPTGDSQGCPLFDSLNSCAYGIFDKGVALFAYTAALAAGQNFSITSTFYTEWNKLGGINGAGRPVTAPVTALTAAIVPPATAGTQYSVQTFSAGAIYSITSGVNKGSIFGVTEPIYDQYIALGGPAGLGVPTGELFQISSSGLMQQTFEGGTFQYTAGSNPVLLTPVKSVQITGAATSGSTTLNLGQAVTLSATPLDAGGGAIAGRNISWLSTNSKVVSVQASGATAVVTAVGAGAASVQASSQGVASAKVNFVVVTPCCQIGEGAPSAVQQAFQDALSRNKIAVQPPVQAPAARVVNGYVQMVQSSAGSVVMLAQSDTLGTAYVVSGPLLAAYQSTGGPSGSLGYPLSDASAGGTQLFVGGALAGTPVRAVSGVILTKWAALGYEAGAAGLPQSDAAPFATPGVNSGLQQAFTRGTIFGGAAGPLAGKAYLVSGLILLRYAQLGGPAGDLGMPVGDEFANGAVRQQNFENGTITYAPGDAAAAEHINPRTPSVVVAPSAVTAGGTARLAVTGFANNSTLRVTITGEPAFVVTTANGAYAWDRSVPLSAKSGTIAIHAADTASSATADGALTIRGFDGNRVQMTKVQGDNQAGPPGALLPLSLRVALLDASNAPVVGAVVTFQPAPGVVLSAGSALTDSTGRAETYLRLPAVEGVTAVTVSAPNVAQAPVTFYVRASASTLSGFPNWIMTGDTPIGNGTATIAQKGALLTAVASILRYHQNQGTLRTPNGQSDPPTLNSFLTADCGVDVKGAQRCDGYLAASSTGEQIVNLWRAADFTGGVDVVAIAPSTSAIADLLAQGYPALLSLELSRNGASAGGHFVVATGVAADGSVVVQDPNPFLARTSLNDYLGGFSAGGSTWRATLGGVVQFALRPPAATRFLVGALSQPAALMQSLALAVQSPVGACGIPVELLDSVDSSGASPAAGALVSRLTACDGAESTYQIAVGAEQPFHAFVSDLATAGSSFDVSGSVLATYQATRSQLNLALLPQSLNFAAATVVNAATFAGGIAPGGAVAIFGSGLAGPGATTTVDLDGVSALVRFQTPFQVNAILPDGITPGNHALHIRSAFGSGQQTVTVSAVAPAIFELGSPANGAVTNQDNTLNTPSNPLVRGQTLVIYCTGLGATVQQGPYLVAVSPVTVLLNGQELSPAFAGLTPGSPGLYQVNLIVPATVPPNLSKTLALKQGGQLSNVVNVAIQ